MNKLFEGLTAICLCLDRRKEHWLELQKQVEGIGIKFIPFICGDGSDNSLVYDSIDIVNPDCSNFLYGVPHLKHHHYNAAVSHRKMIQRAIDLKLDKVMLMEDDAVILNRHSAVIESLSQDPNYWAMIEEADLVFTGWWANPDDHPFNVNIEESWKKEKETRVIVVNPNFRIGGLHSVIVKESVYQYILDLPLNNCIDGQLCDASDKFLSILIVPKIVHVRSCWSFTEGIFCQRAQYD